jgi:hypothetical protein
MKLVFMAKKRIPIIVSTAVLAAMAIAFTVLILMLVVPLSLNTTFVFAFAMSWRTVSLVAFFLVIGFLAVVFILYRALISGGRRKIDRCRTGANS